MVEQFEEARQHNVLHSVRRAEDRWDSFQASARFVLMLRVPFCPSRFQFPGS